MNNLYFERADHNIAFCGDIVHAHYLVSGETIDANDHEKIRAVAASMAGIVRELNRPSPKFLVKHGHTVAAIRVYRDMHDCTLMQAKSAVDRMAEKLKGVS